MDEYIKKDELLARIRLNANEHQQLSVSAIKSMIDTTSTYNIDEIIAELEQLNDKGSVTKTERLITKAIVKKAIAIVKREPIEDEEENEEE